MVFFPINFKKNQKNILLSCFFFASEFFRQRIYINKFAIHLALNYVLKTRVTVTYLVK